MATRAEKEAAWYEKRANSKEVCEVCGGRGHSFCESFPMTELLGDEDGEE